MLRSRKEKRTYDKYRSRNRSGSCAFCRLDKGSERVLDETKHFRIVRNIFGYSMWDSCRVTEHLMIVPKRHVGTIDEMSATAQQECVKLISRYEKKGYNVYARALGSSIKSVPHHHIHCIKTDNRRRRFIFHLKRPYIRWMD